MTSGNVFCFKTNHSKSRQACKKASRSRSTRTQMTIPKNVREENHAFLGGARGTPPQAWFLPTMAKTSVRLAPTAHRAARQNASLTATGLNLRNPLRLLSVVALRQQPKRRNKSYIPRRICFMPFKTNPSKPESFRERAGESLPPPQAVCTVRRRHFRYNPRPKTSS